MFSGVVPVERWKMLRASEAVTKDKMRSAVSYWRKPILHGSIALRGDEVRNVRNTALNGAAVKRFADRKNEQIPPLLKFRGLSGRYQQRIAGSSLAADLVLIGIFGVVDVVIPFDDEFALLAVLS
jgi:hypothetical protein